MRVEVLVIWGFACGDGIVDGGRESIFVRGVDVVLDDVWDLYVVFYGGNGDGTVV